MISVIGGYSIEMFALRWLITYQHGFQKEGFENLTAVFREMEVSKFERDYDLGETIFVKDFICRLSSLDYPIKLGLASENDIDNMNMMIEAEIYEKILVRGYTIKAQLNMIEYSENNGDGTVNTCLSQGT